MFAAYVGVDGEHGRGLDYLKQVILDDSLNLCDSLDEQMARVVDTYQCEWKSTLDNPQKLQRFRPFLNSTSGSKVLPYQRARSAYSGETGGVNGSFNQSEIVSA